VTRDIAASVRGQLQNRAKQTGRPFQELLQYFAMERFLYRLPNQLRVLAQLPLHGGQIEVGKNSKPDPKSATIPVVVQLL
jgi:hypothetical protein